MSSNTYMPGDLVIIKQSAWITNVVTWTLETAKKPLKGIFLGRLSEENLSYHDFVCPCRIAVDGNRIVVVDLSKINYFSKRRKYEKVN